MTLALRYAVRSDVGLLREGNEDSAYAGPHLLAIADGMGGHAAGEVASAVAISALTGVGMDGLLRAIDQLLPLDPIVKATFHLPAGDGATLALLHELGKVIETRYTGDSCEVEAEIPESLGRRLAGRR